MDLIPIVKFVIGMGVVIAVVLPWLARHNRRGSFPACPPMAQRTRLGM